MVLSKTLIAEDITAEAFRPYGQLIQPIADHVAFSDNDAQLDLSQGTPRFYIMRLEQKGRSFQRITHHRHCTQCLGALGDKDWFMVVAPPTDEIKPNIDQMRAFRISGHCFIRLDAGTWHAGPYFDHEFVDFYNLELSDTNIVDHWNYDFQKQDNIEWVIQ